MSTDRYDKAFQVVINSYHWIRDNQEDPMGTYSLSAVPINLYRYSLLNRETEFTTELVNNYSGEKEETELIQMDENSFKEFYEETYKKVWRFIFQLCGSYDLTNDIIQDSYIKFLQNVSNRFNFAQKKVYLYKIANNMLKEYFRKKAIEKKAIEKSDFEKSKITDKHLKMDMEKFFAKMELKERELLILAYVEGYSHNEISEITGIKASSIKVLLFRARKNLLTIMGKK